MTASLWDRVLDLCGHDRFNVNVWGGLVFTAAQFSIMGGLFLLTDLTGRPKFLQKYRVQDIRQDPVSLS